MKLRDADGEEPGGKHGDELGQEHPQQQAYAQRKHADEQGLQEQQGAHPSPVQAQQQVGAQLLFPAADHKAVGVEDQKAQHHGYEDGHHVDELKDDADHALVGGEEDLHDVLGLHGVEYIKDAHAEREGEKVHRIILQTPAHILEGQLREHRPSHLPAA